MSRVIFKKKPAAGNKRTTGHKHNKWDGVSTNKNAQSSRHAGHAQQETPSNTAKRGRRLAARASVKADDLHRNELPREKAQQRDNEENVGKAHRRVLRQLEGLAAHGLAGKAHGEDERRQRVAHGCGSGRAGAQRL